MVWLPGVVLSLYVYAVQDSICLFSVVVSFTGNDPCVCHLLTSTSFSSLRLSTA